MGASDGASDDDLTRRALAAYYRAGGTAQPANASGVVVHDGRLYVQLVNVNGTLAVYRVRNDGQLKRLKRWPALERQDYRPAARYLRRIPREVPADVVVVHNHVRPTRHLGSRGFHAWLQAPDADRLEVCECGWAPELESHYRMRRVGE
jgi:hypothetical protein